MPLYVPPVRTHRFLAATWALTGIGPNQTNRLMRLGGVANLDHAWLSTRSGWLRSLSFHLNASAVGTAPLIRIFKDGVDTGVALSVAVGQNKSKLILAQLANQYLAENRLDCRITTGAGWSASIAVVAHLETEEFDV